MEAEANWSQSGPLWPPHLLLWFQHIGIHRCSWVLSPADLSGLTFSQKVPGASASVLGTMPCITAVVRVAEMSLFHHRYHSRSDWS